MANMDFLKSNPEAAKVMEWRHKLQGAFLSKSVPKPEEMPEYDQLFTTIENHDVTIEQLTYSKLGKIMSHITRLDQRIFPNEDKFSIQRRAKVLLDKWKGLIAAAGEGGAPSANASAVNGTGGTGKNKAEKKDELNTPMEADKEPVKPGHANGDAAQAADIPAEASVAAPASEEAVAMDTADD